MFEWFRRKDFRVHYARLPISPEQRPEDEYLDRYVAVMQKAGEQDALVFNCGMGVGRSAFTNQTSDFDSF